MSEFIKKYQCIISSKEARAVGKTGLGLSTSDMIKEFFDDVCKAVLNAEDEVFLIQWAVIKLNEEERNAIGKGKEQESN